MMNVHHNCIDSTTDGHLMHNMSYLWRYPLILKPTSPLCFAYLSLVFLHIHTTPHTRFLKCFVLITLCCNTKHLRSLVRTSYEQRYYITIKICDDCSYVVTARTQPPFLPFFDHFWPFFWQLQSYICHKLRFRWIFWGDEQVWTSNWLWHKIQIYLRLWMSTL